MTRRNDQRGFSLIELLVVMIIIGVLAGIAIPVLLNQRAKARDAATKSDLGTVAKELTSYYVDGESSSVVTGTISGTTLTLAATGWSNAIRLTTGTTYRSPATDAVSYQTGTGCTKATGWVVTLSNPAGATKTYYLSAQSGLSATAVNLSAACS